MSLILKEAFSYMLSSLCNLPFPSQISTHRFISDLERRYGFIGHLLRSQVTFSWYTELWPTSVICSHKIHMLNSAGVCSRGKWIIYKNLSWHLLSNVERWRQNSCYCCRKQSAGDWIKVSRKWLLDSLLFSLIQLDVSLSCQLGITAVWFINRLSDLPFSLVLELEDSSLYCEHTTLLTLLFKACDWLGFAKSNSLRG